MDEITLDGKTYISSKRAAAITGYAKDYIGQLCREGRVDARLIGRSWYVYEPSIRKHRFKDEVVEEETTSITTALAPQEVEAPETESDITSNHAIFESPRYTPEETAVLPQLAGSQAEEEITGDNQELQHEIADDPIPTPEEVERESTVQSEWNDWFVRSREPEKQFSSPDISNKTKAEAVHVRKTGDLPRPVHDIRPLQPRIQSYEQAVYTSAAIRPKTEERELKQKGNPILNAIFIAIILISISLAVVASGMTERLVKDGPLSGLIMILGGASVIEK